LVPPNHGGRQLASRTSGPRGPTPIDPRSGSPSVYLSTIRIRSTIRQDRPQGTAILRPTGRRLFPRTAPRTSGSGRAPREHPILEEEDRADRSRPNLQGRVDLWTQRVWKKLPGQSGITAPVGRARPAGLRGSDRRGDRSPAAQGHPQGVSRTPSWVRTGRFAGATAQGSHLAP